VVQVFNRRSGEYSTAGVVEGGTWTSTPPAALDSEDWVLLVASLVVAP
jgi:hypothetical protein